jgi:uncharacterized RDD family membrane protein YckC
VAGVGSRVLAGILDGILQMVIQVVWLFALIFLAGLAGLSGPVVLVGFFAGSFLVDWAYFAGTEIAMHGRTPGKKAVGLRVVTRGGGSASAGQLLTRNLVRVVDLIVGIPLMAIDPLSRRLGDRLAGTIVIHDRAAAAEPLLRRVPAGWQATDVALVESLLRRSRDLEPARADEMAYRVLERLEREQPAFLEGARRPGDAPLTILRRAFGVESS